MSTHPMLDAVRAVTGLPPHVLPLPIRPEVRLFADAADATWLVDLIAAHQVLPEIRALGIQCWMLHVPGQGAARLSCQGWRGGSDLVSLLLPACCLHPALHQGGAQLHELVVAGGVLWTESAWTRPREGVS